jgi:hypothetical protein
MQRAAFWNHMDKDHNWHVFMDEPEVAETIDIEVTPAIGTLTQDTAGNFFGDVPIDFLDSQAQTILQLLGLGADTLPIFVTDGVTAQSLGYHTAYAIQDEDGTTRLQTCIFTSWFDLALVGPLLADPQGNGPTFADFPTYASTRDGVTYHLQQLVLWQWFADEVPSSAFGGSYTYLIP